jgi:hypothetical protein
MAYCLMERRDNVNLYFSQMQGGVGQPKPRAILILDSLMQCVVLNVLPYVKKMHAMKAHSLMKNVFFIVSLVYVF